MKTILSILLALIIVSTQSVLADGAIKHVDLPDITTMEEAESVFATTTTQLKEKKLLNPQELHEIHMITYSLEKAIAYFVESLKDDQQAMAKEMAEIVELIHISSENNRSDETRANLERYFNQVETFSKK